MPDVPVCVEIHPAKGFCTYTLSGREQFVDDKQLFMGRTWWELRPSFILVPAPSWAEIKKFVIQTCKTTGDCDENVAAWERTVHTIDSKIVKKEGVQK